MTSFDTEIQALVTSLLLDLGTDYTFTVLGTQTYDEATGITTESTPTDYVVKGSPPYPDSFLQRFDDVTDEDKFMIIEINANVTPERSMLVTHDSKKYKIVKVVQIWAQDQVAAYELRVNL